MKINRKKSNKPFIYHELFNGKNLIVHVGFYWAMRHTKGIRPTYYTYTKCSVCGDYDREGFLYQLEKGDYVGLCTRCKRNMKNTPSARIIYTPMGNKR